MFFFRVADLDPKILGSMSLYQIFFLNKFVRILDLDPTRVFSFKIVYFPNLLWESYLPLIIFHPPPHGSFLNF